MVYADSQVYNVLVQNAIGLIQAINIYLSGNCRITAEYVFPAISARGSISFIDQAVLEGSNAEWIFGDLKTQSEECEPTTNPRGWELLRRLQRTR